MRCHHRVSVFDARSCAIVFSMSKDLAQLDEVRDAVLAGKTRRMKVRTLLAVFGAQRRSQYTVEEIDAELRRRQLRTEPEFTEAHIDAQVSFQLIPSEKPARKISGAQARNDTRVRHHAVRRIGMVVSPAYDWVAPDASFEKAITKLKLSDKPIAVASGPQEGHLRGVVTWRCLAEALHHRKDPPGFVQDAMEPKPYVVDEDRPLLEAVPLVELYGVVAVQDSTHRITGLVSRDDLAGEFAHFARPFLLVGEIELALRPMAAPLDGADSATTLGELVHLLDRPSNWKLVGLPLDRATVIENLNKVVELRNDLMHFSPDPPSDDDIALLERVAKMLRPS